MVIKINRIINKTASEGPGLRYCIFVQGCSIRCEGCMNKNMWLEEEGVSMDTSQVIHDIFLISDEIEGITFLGGEPWDQVEAVCEITLAAKKMGLTAIVFTGYQYDFLLKKNDLSTKMLLKELDILIDGPYVASLCSYKRPWVGSSNQNFYFLTKKYGDIKNEILNTKNTVELRILQDGKIMLNGMGDISQLLAALGMENESNG